MSMPSPFQSRLRRTLALSLLALAVGAGIGFYQLQMERRGPQAGNSQNVLSPMAGIKLGGDFALVDQDGKPVTAASYTAPFKLIYFGFTYCPEICPTELRKMAQVMKNLGALEDKVQPLFITVDPYRDTPAAMKNFVGLFHPRLQGLTGTPEQVKKVMDDYKVYAARAQGKDPENYMMDHSSFVYLMGPDNQLLALYRTQDKPEDIAREITAQLQAAENQ